MLDARLSHESDRMVGILRADDLHKLSPRVNSRVRLLVLTGEIAGPHIVGS